MPFLLMAMLTNRDADKQTEAAHYLIQYLYLIFIILINNFTNELSLQVRLGNVYF